jgi:hypothetical protein
MSYWTICQLLHGCTGVPAQSYGQTSQSSLLQVLKSQETPEHVISAVDALLLATGACLLDRGPAVETEFVAAIFDRNLHVLEHSEDSLPEAYAAGILCLLAKNFGIMVWVQA